MTATDPRYNHSTDCTRRRIRLQTQVTKSYNKAIIGGYDAAGADGMSYKDLGAAAENLYIDECKSRGLRAVKNPDQSGPDGIKRVVDVIVTKDNVNTKYLVQVKSTNGPDDDNHMDGQDKIDLKKYAKKNTCIAYEVHYNVATGERKNAKIYAPKGSVHEAQ